MQKSEEKSKCTQQTHRHTSTLTNTHTNKYTETWQNSCCVRFQPTNLWQLAKQVLQLILKWTCAISMEILCMQIFVTLSLSLSVFLIFLSSAEIKWNFGSIYFESTHTKKWILLKVQRKCTATQNRLSYAV